MILCDRVRVFFDYHRVSSANNDIFLLQTLLLVVISRSLCFVSEAPKRWPSRCYHRRFHYRHRGRQGEHFPTPRITCRSSHMMITIPWRGSAQRWAFFTVPHPIKCGHHRGWLKPKQHTSSDQSYTCISWRLILRTQASTSTCCSGIVITWKQVFAS